MYSGISRVNTILVRIDGLKMTNDQKNSCLQKTIFENIMIFTTMLKSVTKK